jgi:hypothetical protein
VAFDVQGVEIPNWARAGLLLVVPASGKQFAAPRKVILATGMPGAFVSGGGM